MQIQQLCNRGCGIEGEYQLVQIIFIMPSQWIAILNCSKDYYTINDEFA